MCTFKGLAMEEQDVAEAMGVMADELETLEENHETPELRAMSIASIYEV